MHQKVMNGVNDKDCRRCYPSRPKPTTHVLDRMGVFGCTCQYRLCSSTADRGWRFVSDAILLGHRRVTQWVLARTPTVH